MAASGSSNVGARRLIMVLHDDVDVVKIALGQVNAMIAETEAMNDSFEIEDTEEEIRTFEGHLDIMAAAINSELIQKHCIKILPGKMVRECM
nr:hypothetical protein [Tanacetum cinerariifolium]